MKHLSELFTHLKANDSIDGDFPTVEEARAAASCFLKSDHITAEHLKKELWLRQVQREMQAIESDEDDVDYDLADDYEFLAEFENPYY